MRLIISAEVTTQDLDKLLIPNPVYDLVIERKTKELKKYLEQHPKLMFNIAEFNQALKVSNQYAAQQKCNCSYQIPWLPYYSAQKGIRFGQLYITFTQQVDLYRYMIRYWYPSPQISNMRYLSLIALGTLQELKQAKQYIGAGKDPCVVGNKDVIVGKCFVNNYQFVQYLDNHYIWL